MPNLNLKGDAPDEIPDMSEGQEPEPMNNGSGGSFRKMLPIVAGVLVALLLAAYILNRVGVVHLWGNKKASSMMVSEPIDTAQQALTDSAMAEQFRKDSIEAVAAVAASKKAPAKGKRGAEAVKTPAKKVEGAPAKKAEVKPSAQSEQRNMTTVEVPGVTRRQSAGTQQQSEDVYGAKRRGAEASRQEHAGAAPKTQAAKPRAEHQMAAASPKSESTEPWGSVPEGSGKYSVQISSWMSASKARAFAERFTQAGIPSFVIVEGRLHRVCTGRFATRAAAVKRAEELVPMLESKYDIIILK